MNLAEFLRATSVIASMLCVAVSLGARERLRATPQSTVTVDQAESLLALSERQNIDNHAVSLRTAQQALALWQTLANQEGIARTYAMIARCYFAQSDLPQATQNYEKALAIWRDLNNVHEEAESLIMLGFVEDRKGDWSNSIALLTQAESLIAEKNEPSQMGQIASGLADIFNESGLPENGLFQYQRALDYYRQTPDTIDETIIIWALGSTYYRLGNYPEALTYLQQALTGVPPESAYAAICNEYLGRVHSSMEDFPTALQYFQSALEIYRRAINPKEAARVLGLMGQINQQQGKVDQARQLYQQALRTFSKLSDRINQAAILYALGGLELSNGYLELAENYLRESIATTENVRQVSTSRDLTAAFTASVYERYETYIECLMRRHDARPGQGFAVRGFETSELARGRSLAEVLRATETKLAQGIDPQLAAQEKELRQSLRAKQDYRITLLSKAYKKEEIDALQAELGRLEEQYKHVSETIRARYPAYDQITRPTAWDLRQIQEQVIADDQTLLLEYSLGAEQSYAWVVTRDDIKSFSLPSRTLINNAAQKAYQLLATPPASDAAKELPAALQELSRMVLSPLAGELSKRRIIVVADGALHYIPFQVLPLSSAENELLADNYEILNAPSASILGELRKEATQRQPTKVLAAFGDPVFASNYAQRKDATGSAQSATLQAIEIAPLQNALRDIELNGDAFDPSVIQPLFFAKRELANLRDSATSGETFVASGFAATREQLLSMDLTQYAILHFATHGLLDPKRPENSGLVLSTINRDGQSQNGFVGLQDIYGLHAPVDLVVLSACQTALGKDVRGEGLLGLTRGFMYAGASSVLASLWKVDDEATSELMKLFYNNMLKRKMTPAAALREAQNSIRQKPEWKAPYYWAGFTLQGEYRQIIRPTSHQGNNTLYRAIAITGALMLLIGAASWYRYRRLREQGKVSYSTTKK